MSNPFIKIEGLSYRYDEESLEMGKHPVLNDLSMDSLRMVMLLLMIEEVFAIELDESDMNPFALITVQDVIDLVSKYKGESEDRTDG